MKKGAWMRIFFTLLLAILPIMAPAWTEPARGSPDRSALMDALRPHAEWIYGAPVQFVVDSLRMDGNVAFAAVRVQRPGGDGIDVAATPGWAEGYFLPDADHTSGQALYWKSGATWVAVHVTFGATDVWWAQPRLCQDYGQVIPEVCP